MNKRVSKFGIVLCLFFFLIAIISIFARFRFPSYADILMASFFFSIGGGEIGLYVAIKPTEAARTQEALVSWWKSWNLVQALTMISWGALFLTFQLPDQSNEVLRTTLSIFFFALCLGLTFYAAILLFQHTEADRRRRQDSGVQEIPQRRPLPKDE